MSIDKYIPLSKWDKHYNWPSVIALRNMRIKSKELGMNNVFKKAGGTVLVDREEFFNWIEEQATLNKDKEH